MPDDDQYRRAVQGKVEEILSTRHEKSTGKLIAEALVEGARLYRGYKEEEKKEERVRGRCKERNDEENKTRSEMGKNEKHVKPRHHRHAHGKKSGESRERYRHRHRHRSRSRQRDESLSRNRIRKPQRDNSSFDGKVPMPHQPPRSPSQFHQRHPDTRTERVARSRSPKRVPFGSLPRYKPKVGITLGLGDHFMNTYRHIKAEHDAGYRTKGFIEKALDEARKKREDTKSSKSKQDHGRHRERENHRVSKKRPREVQWAERDPEIRGARRGRQSKPIPEIRVETPTSSGTSESENPERETRTLRDRSLTPKPPRSSREHPVPRSPIPAQEEASYECEASAPLEHHHSQPQHNMNSQRHQNRHYTPPKLPSPTDSTISSRDSSPVMPRGPPPPPPLPPPRLRSSDNARSDLLDSIQIGIKLRRVASSEKKDKSENSGAGKVLYEQTAESKEGTDTRPEPNRAFREGLLNALQGRT